MLPSNVKNKKIQLPLNFVMLVVLEAIREIDKVT